MLKILLLCMLKNIENKIKKNCYAGKLHVTNIQTHCIQHCRVDTSTARASGMFAAAQMRFSSFLWLDIESTAGILISKFAMLQYALQNIC